MEQQQATHDLEVRCAVCRTVFVLTRKDQAFFLGRGLVLPKRCKACRLARRQLARHTPHFEERSV